MSTQQILGVVGGVVGAFFGYPQLGFVVGSLVGGLLTPGEKTEGPRVDDLKVQVSTYGAGIARLRGTERAGGNVVWSTDKIEEAETTGGKGAAPEHTSYRYFVHMGIVLCETPRDGSIVNVVQILQDGKLIWDARSGIPIGSALASAENPHANFVLYQGHADQLPDPGEEAWMGGPGSVPAYRGVVRIRMNAIECPGGRVPQFSFVISTNSAVEVTESLMFQAPSGSLAYGAAVTSEGAWHLVGVAGANPAVDVYYGSIGGVSRVRRMDLPYSGSGNFYYVRPIQGQTAGLFFVDDHTNTNIYRISFEDGTTTRLTTQENTVDYFGGNTGGVAQDTSTDRYAWFRMGTAQPNQPLLLKDGQIIEIAPFSGSFGPLAFYDSVIYGIQESGGTLSLAHRDGSDGTVIGSDITGPTLASVTIARSALQVTSSGIFAMIASGAHALFYLITDAGWTLLADAEVNLQNASISTTPTFWTNGKSAVVADSDQGDYFLVQFQAVTTSDVKVSDIIADLCERAGETRYDVSGIPDADTLKGYKLQNPATARADIDPLLTAFAIYIVDEDGVIKFKKYEDIVSEATIVYDELGQAEDGAEPADAMPLNRAQEIDLPRSVSVSYIEPTFDYQTATEKEVRQITDATEDLIVELPIATTSNHAKQVASMILFAKWRAQNTRSFKTSRKYAFLSPGDGVTVEYPRGTFRLWRITSMTDTGALCEFNAEPGDAELYTQSAIGATGYAGQEVSPLAPLTRLQLLDVPILRDADNNAGLYAALSGFGTGWPGGELFVGDDDVTLESRGTVQNESPIGICEGALGTWALGVIDETNLLTVDVSRFTLSSITQDLLLTGTSNVAAIGAPGRWEIVKFQRADSLGSGRYILSGFLRGQRGTEHNRSNHAVGDTFVLLAIGGMLRPNLEAGSIGQTKSYRAVTKGRSLNSAASQTYANTAEGLEPFSPTNLTKSISSGDITFQWVRRTRLSENWLAGVVPVGEASQSFLTVLYTDSTFATELRVIASSANSSTYTTAMQSADGYTTGPLYVRVYQVSDVVGRGHALEATI